MRAFCLSECLLRILIGGVHRNIGRDLYGDKPVHPVRIRPRDIPEVIVEGLEDVAKPVEFRLGLAPAAARRHRVDLGIWSGSWIFIAAFFSTR